MTWLLLFQLAGELIVRVLGAPIPGPVVGMVLLFFVLRLRAHRPSGVEDTSGRLLQHLSLLFVPAGVGVVAHGALLASEWLAIVAALLASTVLSVAATALVMRLLLPREAATPEDTA